METLKSILQEIWNQLKPPQAFSWQTSILLSVFSWCLSFLTETEVVEEFLAWMGWFFLTFGIAWGLWNTKLNIFGWHIRPSPWIAGAMVCLLLFRGAEENEALPFPLALTIWPLVSAAIAILPRLFPYFSFKLPDPPLRQELMILFLVSLLMSCWFRFHFLVQDWIAEYPTILADDFSKSGFIIRFDMNEVPSEPAGIEHLDALNERLETELEGQPWQVAERWLIERDDNIQEFENSSRFNPNGRQEDLFWRFQSQVPPQQSRTDEYTLNLRAVWNGPSSRPGGYFLERSCVVRQAADQGVDPQTALASPITFLECDPTDKTKRWISPPPTTTNTTGGVG